VKSGGGWKGGVLEGDAMRTLATLSAWKRRPSSRLAKRNASRLVTSVCVWEGSRVETAGTGGQACGPKRGKIRAWCVGGHQRLVLGVGRGKEGGDIGQGR